MAIRKALWLGLLILWCVACTPAASDAVSVSYSSLLAFDAPVTQTLSGPNTAHEWSFVAEAGRTITIDLHSQGIQPALALRFGSQTITTAAAGSYPNSLTLAGIPLPTTGTYIIRLTQPGPETGTYTLTITAAEEAAATPPTISPAPGITPTTTSPAVTAAPEATRVLTLEPLSTSDPEASAQLLQPFRSTPGRISYPGEIRRYTIFSRADSTLSLGVSSDAPSLTPSLEVYAPSGDLLAQNEQATASWSAAIIGLSTPTTGAYVVFVADATGRQTGDFTVSYGPGLAITEAIQGQAAPEATVSGLLDTALISHSWTLDLSVGDVISAAAVVDEAGTLDPILSLIGPDGQVLYSDDNSGGGRNAAIRRAIAPQTGSYRLTISPAAGNAAYGTYTLIWRYDTQPTPTP